MTCLNTLLLKVTKWCNARNFTLVSVLSILHVGLAYMHTRDSGRADTLLLATPLNLAWA
jgi:hypothetical protein